MEKLTFELKTARRAGGLRQMAIIGVVGSGDLEVLAERVLPDDLSRLEISTAAEGFGEVWKDVVTDFVARRSPGGLRLSINDGGARPDTVALRLAQAVRLMEDDRR